MTSCVSWSGNKAAHYHLPHFFHSLPLSSPLPSFTPPLPRLACLDSRPTLVYLFAVISALPWWLSDIKKDLNKGRPGREVGAGCYKQRSLTELKSEVEAEVLRCKGYRVCVSLSEFLFGVDKSRSGVGESRLICRSGVDHQKAWWGEASFIDNLYAEIKWIHSVDRDV